MLVPNDQVPADHLVLPTDQLERLALQKHLWCPEDPEQGPQLKSADELQVEPMETAQRKDAPQAVGPGPDPGTTSGWPDPDTSQRTSQGTADIHHLHMHQDVEEAEEEPSDSPDQALRRQMQRQHRQVRQTCGAEPPEGQLDQQKHLHRLR